jgi:hypothetical protein
MPELIEMRPYASFSRDEFLKKNGAAGAINVALVSQWFPYKGSDLYEKLAKEISRISVGGVWREVIFHAFRPNYENVSHLDHIHFHAEYKDADFQVMMQSLRIDVAMHLSLFPETFCYALSRSLLLGVPIVFLNRGSVGERLHEVSRAFPSASATVEDVHAALQRAVEWAQVKRLALHQSIGSSAASYSEARATLRFLVKTLSKSVGCSSYLL